MEDVLDLYAEPYDPDRPVVCFDETTTSAAGGLAEVRERLPARPGRPRRQDYEYRRGGIRNLFLTCEPRAGWRHVAITERRTMVDFAHRMRWLVDTAYPHAPVIRVVLDNLNTHRMASLYETFPAAAARRIVKRLEFHHTPKHAIGRGMADDLDVGIGFWPGFGQQPNPTPETALVEQPSQPADAIPDYADRSYPPPAGVAALLGRRRMGRRP